MITVSTGDQEPSAQSDSADTAASSDAPAQTADNSAAAAAGEVWKCTQTLNTPSGYSGGPVRLELIQNVNGTPTASVVLEDQVIQFPYDLNITGAPGISEVLCICLNRLTALIRNSEIILLHLLRLNDPCRER